MAFGLYLLSVSVLVVVVVGYLGYLGVAFA